MNCLLYCIIYDLLSLPSRPSLETLRWRGEGTVEEGWRTSISIILFHCGSFSPTPSISCSISPPASSPALLMFLFCTSPAPTLTPPPEGNAAFPNVVFLLNQRRRWNNAVWGRKGGVFKDPSALHVWEHFFDSVEGTAEAWRTNTATYC